MLICFCEVSRGGSMTMGCWHTRQWFHLITMLFGCWWVFSARYKLETQQNPSVTIKLTFRKELPRLIDSMEQTSSILLPPDPHSCELSKPNQKIGNGFNGGKFINAIKWLIPRVALIILIVIHIIVVINRSTFDRELCYLKMFVMIWCLKMHIRIH